MKTLPRNWCIQITKENIELLIEWRAHGKDSLTANGIGGYLHSNKIWQRDTNGYPVLSLEEFKELVLKEEKKEETPIDVNMFVVGKWYKSDKGDKDNWYYIKVNSFDQSNYILHGDCIRPGRTTNNIYQKIVTGMQENLLIKLLN